MLRELGEPRGELVHGQHDVGDFRRDDGARHRFVRRFLRVLHEHDAAGVLHCARAERAVGAAARQDHREAVAVLLRQRAKEHVDGRAPLAQVPERRRRDRILRDLELAVRRDHVDAVRLQVEPLMILYLDDAHGGAAAEDPGELALVVGREMHDHDVSQAEIVGERAEQLPQRIDAASRRADPHHADAWRCARLVVLHAHRPGKGTVSIRRR